MAKVKKDFDADYYKELSFGRKFTESETLVVSDSKTQKPTNFISRTNVDHQTLEKDIELIIECHKLDKSKFGFKLRESLFDPKPFFRFESAGSADRNGFDDIPLAQQQITTPHFHKYDENGRFLAFKTDKIMNLTPPQTNITMCFNEFCDITNLKHNDDYPAIKTTPARELELGINEENPLKNVIFDK